MGEIAEMMLDGTMCQVCGEFINEDPPGYPVTCGGCARDEYPDAEQVIHVGDITKPARCPDCNKRFKNGNALGQHWDAKHGG